MLLTIDAAALDAMKYAELQKLAKKIGVKANMKADKLLKTIKEHVEQQVDQPDIVGAATPESHAEESGEQAEVEETEVAPRPSKRTGCKGRKGRKQNKEDVQALSSDNVVSFKQTDPLVQVVRSPTPKSSDETTQRTTPVVSAPKYCTPKECSATKTVTAPIRHRTRTISPAKPPSVPATVITKTKRRTHTVSPKVATPVRKDLARCTPVQSAANTPGSGSRVEMGKAKRWRPVGDSEDVQPSRSKRVKIDVPVVEEKRVSTVSPGVKGVLDSLDGGLTDAQLRESIHLAVDRRVQEKSNDGSSSSLKTMTVAGTNIPRFTALARGFSVTKQQPGHKDWARIHERAFSKMDSIDVYLKKRHERTQSVSAMKVQEMTARMRTALTSLKKLKSPAAALAQKAARIVKPVKGGEAGAKVKSSLFPSPMPNFVPKVTSVRKMNLQFASNTRPKTPRSTVDRSAKENAPSPLNVTFGATRKSGVADLKTKSGSTPFVFRGGLNDSTNDPKKQFDLQKSLATKITWKPHRGKLQPYVAPDLHRAPPKEVRTHTRDQRRVTAQKHRAGKRLDSQLSRRGLTITS